MGILFVNINGKQEEKEMIDVFREMADKWPSAVVARTEIERFTGGLITSKYQANLDSAGLGPESVKVGRKVGYSTITYADWLRNRSK